MLGTVSALVLATSAAPTAAAAPDRCSTLAATLDSSLFTRVVSETDAASDTLPAHCQVTGTIRPTVGFVMRLLLALADPLVVPTQSIDYYNRVAKRMGGQRKTQSFFRLFLAPGLAHCWEIPSATAPEEFDPLTAIENWVERNRAPDHIVATPSQRQGDTLSIKRVVYRPYPLPPVVGAAR